ncbi:hypothetical protein MNB_SV-13-1348 [hydrothermal vent metagenome]|uniref:Uncharacterized protein n=1 Tax=hydrothermal vent metagenome TaxID=652676 RepID=A0A1W1D0M0_9ZZZZ
MLNTHKIKELFKTELKLLSFKSVKIDIETSGNYYFFFGLVMTWLAGIGRHWDNPRAEIWQYFGLSSVMYVFILAFIIWILIKPLKPQNWSYKGVLIFVMLTSPTAFFYAIPVERYFSMDTAQTMNVWFLLLVALWRVILFFLYLKRVAKLKSIVIVTAMLLPLVLIVSTLTALNLEHVVFRLMAGITEEERSGNDGAYAILWLISTLSVMLSPVFLLSYLISIYNLHRKPKVKS